MKLQTRVTAEVVGYGPNLLGYHWAIETTNALIDSATSKVSMEIRTGG